MTGTIEWTPEAAIQHALWEDGDTQRDLADRLGWSEVKLSKTLNGKRRLLAGELRQVAKAQSRDYSWYYDPPPFRPPSPDSVFPLSLDLGRRSVNPRYDKLREWVHRPIDYDDLPDMLPIAS